MKYQSVSKRFEPIPVFKDSTDMTVPDMSFTPREIIAKFSRGEKVPLGFKGLYDSEDDPENDKYGEDPSIWQDDPTRDPSFDFGDYVEEKRALNERQRSKDRRNVPAKRKARSEELSASDATRSETTSEQGASAGTVQQSE